MSTRSLKVAGSERGWSNTSMVIVHIFFVCKLIENGQKNWLPCQFSAPLEACYQDIATSPQDVFNIVTHPKFASGVSEKYGKRHLDLLCAGHSWQSALSSTAGKTRQLKVQ